MFHIDIKSAAKKNNNFRQVIYTGDYSQLVLMSIPRGSDIGLETHQGSDQILFFVKGDGEATIGNKTFPFHKHDVVFVPAGTSHNFKNTGDEDLKLYTVYSPAMHATNTVHQTKEDAMYEEEYDKKATSLADDFYENM